LAISLKILQGQISYADSTHRTEYLNANGYTDLSAAQARAAGLTIKTRSGDVRNAISIKYGVAFAGDYTTSDAASIALYGSLGQVFSTYLKNASDAEDQGEFYLDLRAYPQAVFDSVTYDLTNPLIDDGDRDSLISVFMGLPVNITELPLNMNAGSFQGFVEGWTFQASYNRAIDSTFRLTARVQPSSYALE
jgi:hypothetical protein